MRERPELRRLREVVLDMQAADARSFSVHFVRAMTILTSPTLSLYTNDLMAKADLTTFLAEHREKSRDRMGGGSLRLTKSAETNLGLIIQLIEVGAEDPDRFRNIVFSLFTTPRFMDAYHSLVNALLIPFERDYNDYVSARLEEMMLTVPRENTSSSDASFSWDGKQGQLHEGTDSSTWTGISSSRYRLQSFKQLLVPSKDAVDALIEHYSQGASFKHHNGGPPLVESTAAIEALRKLHKDLSDLLNEIDGGTLDDGLGNDLCAKMFRHLRGVVATVKNDPVPYATATLLFTALQGLIGPDLASMAAHTAMVKNSRVP